MLSRSFGFTPRMLLIPIRMPRPSGYCGAASSMRQIGTRKSPSSVIEAIAVSQRAARDMLLSSAADNAIRGRDLRLLRRRWGFRQTSALGFRRLGDVRRERHVLPRCGDARVSLHLLMQRGAEVGAIEGIDAHTLRDPRQGSGCAGRENHAGCGRAEHREAMPDVPVLLDVGHVKVDGVADLDSLEIVGCEMTPNGYQLHIDAFARARDATLGLGFRRVGILLL